MFDPFGQIHVKYINRCTTDGGEADECWAILGKVLRPRVLAGIEQAGEFA